MASRKKAPRKKAVALEDSPRGDTQQGTNGHSRTQQRAYLIWEREGRPHGRAHDHWFQAEAEVTSETGSRMKALSSSNGEGGT